VTQVGAAADVPASAAGVGAVANTTRASGVEIAQALCALLPALVLAWPLGGPLEHDFSPRSTGFGLAAVLSLPGLVLFVLRRAAPRVPGMLLLATPLLACALWLAFGAPVDPFEASRATLTWALVLATFLLGAASDPRTLVRGAAIIGLAAAASGLAHPPAGALGNAGATSEAATLGAGAALVLALTDRSIWRWIALAALAAFAAHATQAPVLTGLVALAVASAFAAIATRGPARSWFAVMVAIACIALVVVFARHTGDEARTPTANAQHVDTSPASGVGVRAAVHLSSARLFAAHPLVGVGPGQFPAEFPPFRDPAEIEASSHGRLAAAETEVEHAHDDWIQPALEFGILPGLAWIGFLVVVLVVAWRALRAGDAYRAALGVGLVALLVHALGRAPITSNAASATLFAAAAGALLVRRGMDPRGADAPTLAQRFAVLAPMLVLLALAPRAWSMVRHGFALHALADERDDPEGRERAIERAARFAPDSVLVQSLQARLAEAHGEPPARVGARWSSVLALRPHRVEALVQFASAAAGAGDVAAARGALHHALELDPGNPPALQNLAVLELRAGDIETGLALFDRIPSARAPDPEWTRTFAGRLALRGLDEESAALTARVDPLRTSLTPEERYALAKELRAAGRTDQADGWEARAHRAWADQHAAAQHWTEAVRSLRQELRLCLERQGSDPVRVRLALAAALHAAGREDEAREQIAACAPPISARDLSCVPAWARAPLAELGAQ
jgi:O-antigen ligase